MYDGGGEKGGGGGTLITSLHLPRMCWAHLEYTRTIVVYRHVRDKG